jgi:hypothetical protein
MVNIMNWRKSSYSSSNSGNCTEVATVPGAVLVRDSKDAEGPRLSVGTASWKAFTDLIKSRLYRCRFPLSSSISRAGLLHGFQLEDLRGDREVDDHDRAPVQPVAAESGSVRG